MVSRRKILSRSRDDLNLDQSYITQEEEEDVWYQKEKLYKMAPTILSNDCVPLLDNLSSRSRDAMGACLERSSSSGASKQVANRREDALTFSLPGDGYRITPPISDAIIPSHPTDLGGVRASEKVQLEVEWRRRTAHQSAHVQLDQSIRAVGRSGHSHIPIRLEAIYQGKAKRSSPNRSSQSVMVVVVVVKTQISESVHVPRFGSDRAPLCGVCLPSISGGARTGPDP
uniref:Uncharacterized protein n=1 Tax=Anopheles farauti TaxID=69004 RepID=A0A182Q0E0_9DIPT